MDGDLWHAPVGVIIFLLALLYLRDRSLGAELSLVALLALQLANEALDAWDWWLWTGSVNWGEALFDTLATLVLPVSGVITWRLLRGGSLFRRPGV